MSDTSEDQGGHYQHDVQQVADDASDIQAQLKKLREDLSALATTVTTIGTEKATAYGAKIASDTIEASQNAVEGVRSDYISFEQAVADRIRARPIQAVGVAAGIGYLIAAMRRR